MPLVPRTIPMRLVAAGFALLLLVSLGTAAWFALPRWCPGFVIRYSPWVEPVLRAGKLIHYQYDYHPHHFEFSERFKRWGNPALPYLHRVLFTHSDEDMRTAAMAALVGMADESDAVIAATFTALADRDRFQAVASSELLYFWLRSEEGIAGLRAAYRSLNPKGQATLIDRLPFPDADYWFRQNPRLVRCFLDFLANPNSEARRRAELMLRRMTMEAAFPDCYFVAQMVQPMSPHALDDVLSDFLRSLDEPSDVSGIISWLGRSSAQPVAQMHLAYACTFLRNPTTVPALSVTLTATDSGVRIHALQALRDIGDDRALDAVIPLLADTDESVRCMAVWTIGRLRDSRAKDLLKRALEDPDPLVVLAAERSLAEFLPPPSTSDD